MYDVINYVDCTREQQLEILRLRNLDAIRKWMVNPDVIPEDNHFRFIEKLKRNSERLYFAKTLFRYLSRWIIGWDV